MGRWTGAHGRHAAALDRLRAPAGDAGAAKPLEDDVNRAFAEVNQVRAEINEMIRTAFKHRAPILDALIVASIPTAPLTAKEASERPRVNGDAERRAK